MRGLGSVFKGAVFLAGLVGASTTFAQQDPKVAFYFDNVATCPSNYTATYSYAKAGGVSVSCAYTGSAPAPTTTPPKPTLLELVTRTRDEFVTRTAYDIVFLNNTTNSLNRLYFRVTASNFEGTTDISGAANGTFERIVYTTTQDGSFSCVGFGGSDMTCTSNVSLAPGKAQVVTVVVVTPTRGDKLYVAATAGGYEGNSETGQGCCSKDLGRELTTLVDVAAGDYQVNATTFLTSDANGFALTGKGLATTLDQFATKISAPIGWGANKYDIANITEKSLPEGKGRCKQSKLKYCQESTVSLPNVVYPVPTADVCLASTPLLNITLTVNTSLLKGKVTSTTDWLTAVRIRYDDNSDGTFDKTLSPCGNTSVSATSFPCICNYGLVVDGTNGDYVKYDIVNYKNGSFFMD